MPVADFVGHWNIYETAMWNRAALDLIDPAHIAFDANGRGSLGFIAVSGYLGYEMGKRGRKEAIRFRWEGNDEMDEASGRGWAVITAKGDLEGEIDFQDGDKSTFKARRFPDNTRGRRR